MGDQLSGETVSGFARAVRGAASVVSIEAGSGWVGTGLVTNAAQARRCVLQSAEIERTGEGVGMVDSVHVDPDAVATYEAVAAQVADELTIAAAQLAAGTDPARIGAGLGLLGAEFATEFATAVADEQTALSTASALVAAYGRAVSGYAAATGTVDDSVAAAITKAGEQA